MIDGHVGAAFVQTLVNYLEHPAPLLVGLESRPGLVASMGGHRDFTPLHPNREADRERGE